MQPCRIFQDSRSKLFSDQVIIIIPHYGEIEFNPELREEVYNKVLNDNKYKVYALTNSDSIVVIDEKIEEIRGEKRYGK